MPAPTTALATIEAGAGSRRTHRDGHRVERALVERDVIVPVVHLPIVYGLGDWVESWNGPIVSPTGAGTSPTCGCAAS